MRDARARWRNAHPHKLKDSNKNQYIKNSAKRVQVETRAVNKPSPF